MRTLTINSKLGDYNVVISDTAIFEMVKYIKAHHADATNIFVIYDPCMKNAERLIKYNQFGDSELVFLPLPKKRNYQHSAEEVKTWRTATHLIEHIFAYGAKENSLIIGLGGGATIDMVGFISSLIRKGINCIYCPTTLACSVDGCIGEETAINYKTYKNAIGTFKNPNAVFIDLKCLKSLPIWAIQDGLCDCLKHALICDEGLLYFIKENSEKIYAKDPEVLEELIYRNLVIKKAFLANCLYDKKIALNLGKTVFDALERRHRFGHSISLPLGIIVACRISHRMNLLSIENLTEIENLMSTHFSLEIETGHTIHKDVVLLMQTIMHNDDQRSDMTYAVQIIEGKKKAREIKMVLPVGLDKVEIHTVKPKLLGDVLHTIFCE
jgi:3-dehydroquinate synthetase